MKNRRFLSMLLTLVMVLSMFASIPFAAYAAADTVTVTDWDGLQKAVKSATTGQTIQLGADITCKKNGGDRIKVDGKTITLDLNGHTLDRNRDKRDDDGHVIEVTGKSTLTIIDSKGGGVITGGYAKRGGGINVGNKATCVIEGGTITGNKASFGGGIYVHGKLTMNGGTVTKNKGTDDAGGIFCNDGSTVTLNAGVVISENEGEDCGGVFNEGGTLTMTGVKILNNKSTKHGGGGVNTRDGGKTTLTGCTVTGNEAYGCGGGIYLNEGCELTVDGGTISKNRANNDDGGGIFTKSTVTVKGDVVFDGNYTFASGGAIRVRKGTTTVEGGTFTNNEAGDSGGAIYVNDSTLKLYGGTITGNSTITNEGGAILVGKDASIKVHGAPVVKDNASQEEGNDIFLRGGKQIELDAALESGAVLAVDAEKRDKAFTKNFDKYNSGEDAAAYFINQDGWVILTSGGEGVIRQSNWTELQTLIDAAASGDTLVLDRDYKSVAADAPLTIPEGKALTIDLNGHQLNRGLKKEKQNGCVISNSGTLTIVDSVGGGSITGGWSNDNGGGIWNNGTLTIQDGSITGNNAKNHGGGIHNSGTLTITGGTISNNDAGKDGGGVYTDGDLEISGGEITGNTAGMSGGALRVNGKTTTLTGGTFTGNTATKNHGGGIYLSNATLNLYGGEITGNKAAMEGGGILYGANATVNVQGAPVVTGNTASTGANVLLRAGNVVNVAGALADGAKLDLLAQDTTKALTSGLERSGSDLAAFTYNQERGVAPALQDGELFVDLTVTADYWVSDWDGLQKAVKSATSGQTIALSRNISGKDKGRIKVEGAKSITLELNGHSLDRARTSSDSDGHVIEITGKSTLTITDTIGTGTIKGGYAKRGGGINIEKGSTCVLKGGAITGNKAKLGGGVYAHGTFRMEGGAIAGNEATCIEAAFLNGGMIVKSVATGSGGGIYCGEEGTLELTGGTISGNTSDDAGGVNNGGSKNVKLANVTIADNTSAQGGGGFNNNDGGTATLTNCVIRGNSAKGNGGGLWNQEDSSLTLENCTIEDNTANDQGGGVFTKGTLTVTGGAIKNNTAKGKGGGIRLWDGKATVNSGDITGNTSKSQGGGIYVGGATLNLYGGTITGNTASQEGGGIDVQDHDDAKVNVHGAPVVKDNTAKTGNNVFLSEGKSLKLDGAMTNGANISVTAQELYFNGETWNMFSDNDVDTGAHSGVITSGFATYNNNEDPQKYFISDVEAFSVNLRDGEAKIIESDWSDLQRLIDAAEDGATITLDRNWSAVPADAALNIEGGKILTIDLNGHTLNRGLNAPTPDGAVIMNYGDLTITDSKGGGEITGGYADDHAGGIWNPGTLTLEGGAITGNRCVNNGGGIHNSGELTIKGGTISNNTAGKDGGGVYTEGELFIHGGEFKGNTAGLSGGALRVNGKVTTIYGVTMTGNTATKNHGGAIYLSDAELNLCGGSITGNQAAMEGGGILYGANSALYVEDAPVVNDNSAPTGANLLIRKGQVIHMTSPLTDGAKLDVTAQDTDSALTDGLTKSGSRLDSFTYNDDSVKPALRDGEMVIDFTVEADVWVSDWQGLQDAINNATDGQVIALGNSISANGADRIKVNNKTVTLDLNGYTMNRGRSKQGDDGHVIEVTGKSVLTIRDSRGTGVIKGGYAKRGGGINIAENATCILEGGTIADNKAKWGGGVYAHGTFKMTGGKIARNEATASGGGIHCGEEGTLELTGGAITDNSAVDCGGVFNSGSKNVSLANVRIIGNRATEEGGGGFNNNKGGSATLTGCEIRGNTAAGNGGGFWNQKDSSLTLNNCTVTENAAGGHGGGAFNKGTLTLSGGSFSGNSAAQNGGAVNVSGEAKATNVSGSLVVTGNTAGKGSNLYLPAGKVLTLSGAMEDGAEVRLSLGSNTGTAVSGYDAYHKDVDPTRFFRSDDGFDMSIVEGSVRLDEAQIDLDDSSNFIGRNSRIVSYENVNSRNWMSGISGERKLNEINIPGTHDAAMKDPESAKSLFEDTPSITGAAKYAQTQVRYIDEQLNDGFRFLDLRLNNKYQKSHNGFYEFFTIDYQDDGRNLWLCHGCDKKGGTYYAQNHNGDDTSLDEVLGWVKDFLRKHPTEVVIISIRPETQWEDQYDTIWRRAKKILKAFSMEINPSTGKSYLYMEDGVFGKNYTYYPKLKDVRGQVFLRVNHDKDPNGTATMGGLPDFDIEGLTKRLPGGGFEEPPQAKITHFTTFYNKYGNVLLPRDALTHLDVVYALLQTNVVEKVKYPKPFGNIPVKTPVESAEDVNPALFAAGGLFDRPGYYLGWMMSDGCTADMAARIWRTNFYDMDYVTVTVKSGLSEADLASGNYTETEDTGDGLSEQDETAAAQASGQIPEDGEQPETEEEAGTQTYLLLKGTEITIPQCIYEYDPAVTGRDFQSWNATGETVNETHYPGETFIVMEDTTFTGQWLAEGETSVDVVWQDMDDADGLRVDSLDLEVWPDEDPEHVYTQTVTAADGWRAVLAGDVQKIVPIWERVDGENGADTPEGYRCEVLDAASVAQSDEDAEEAEVSLMGSGLIVRLIHTPGGSVDASGAIEWNDDDNRDGLRPESVTLRLFKGEEELDSQTLTAETEWQYDFGELPYYEDGKKVEYKLVEDEITGYSAFAEELRVTNTHTPKLTTVSGAIFWEDAANENGQRPESVTVRLMANGEELSALTVTADGASTTVLDFPYEEEESTPDGEPSPEEETYEDEDFDEEADEADPEAEPEAPADEGAFETYGGEDESADEGSAYVDNGDEAESAETEATDEATEGGETEALGEAGWVFSFYGVPVNANGQAVEYTIVQDEVEKYDYTIEYSNGYVITNYPLAATVLVTFDANGGTGEMEGVEIEPQSEYTLPESGFTAPEGMEFVGWTLAVEAPRADQPEGDEAPETEAEPEVEAEAETESETEPEAPVVYLAGDVIRVTGNAILTAQWQPIPQPVEITFDANGGEGEMDAAQPDENGEYILPESGFTAPEGLEFVGWKIALEEATTEEAVEGEEADIEDVEEASEEPTAFAEYTYEPGDTIAPSGNATAIAQWQAPTQPIVITFDANGGEGEMEAATPDENGAYTLPENDFTAPEGAEFIGWLIRTEAPEQAEAEAEDETEAEAESASALNPGDVIVVSADTTVIAQWQEAEADLEEISVTVTLKVVNGAWSDGTREDKTIILTGKAGDELRLNFEDLTEMSEPDEGYTLGDWDPQLPFYWAEEDFTYGDPITEDTTYTYTYAPREEVDGTEEEAEEVSVTVTLKVVNGAWGDGTREDKTIVLTGSEGDELRLMFEDIPQITAPDEGYKMGEWDPELSFYWAADDFTYGEPITEDTTYIYTYAPIEEADTGAPMDEQPTEEQPVEEEPTEEQPAEEQPTEEQPTEEQPVEEQPVEEQPVEEQPIEEQPIEEQPIEEQPIEEQPIEEQPAEGSIEGGEDGLSVEYGDEPVEEQPTEEQPAEGSIEGGEDGLSVEYGDEPAEEQAVEAQPAEEALIAESVEEPAEQPVEEPAEQPAEPAVEAPADVRMCTITFDGGGADGEMAAVQTAAGEYTLPECEYYLDGCAFDVWLVSGADGADPVVYRAGETITVESNLTAMASWLFDEGGETIEGGDEVEYGDDGSAEEPAGDEDTGLDIETEEVVAEENVEIGEEPSETGSVFNGAGIAAIIAAAALVLGGAGIAISKKKKK